MSVGTIQNIKEKDGYSQLMYVDNDGSFQSILLTARELTVGQERASKNCDILTTPTFMDRLISFLVRFFSR